MQVLITGATGFVGQALLLRMRMEGWRVRCAVQTAEDQERLPPGTEAFPVGPIGPDTIWPPVLFGVDIVVHLAARTHMTLGRTAGPLSTYRLINAGGTEHLARAAAGAGVKRFIFLSSVKVNGEGRAEPYTDLDEPAPEDAYGISKWEAEQALHGVADKTSMEIVIIRSPLVYGPGVKANFLGLLKIVHRGFPLPFALVQNRRSFISIGNLVDAIHACATHPKAAGRTYLVSDGVDISTPELVRRVAAALERPLRLVPFPPSLLHLAGRLAGKSSAVDRLLGSLTVDTSKIRRELDWKPPYTMEQGLDETARWFKCIQ